MKKKITLLTAGVLCTVSVITGACASNLIKDIRAQLRPDFTVKIDGKEMEFKNVKGEVVYPVLYEGTTYLPLRAIGNLMGKTVSWNESEKLIELTETVERTVTDADVFVTEEQKKPAQPKENEPKADAAKYIGADAANAIALKRAGLTAGEVIFKRTELDRDKGVVHYEVDFKKGKTEYEAEIDAVNGKILSWEIDIDD